MAPLTFETDERDTLPPSLLLVAQQSMTVVINSSFFGKEFASRMSLNRSAVIPGIFVEIPEMDDR